MSARLLPCPSCARHVRASESTCPFCASALAASTAAPPLPRSPRVRLSRAALFALGASAAAIAACGGDSTSTGTGTQAGDAAADAFIGNSNPPYGAVPLPDSGVDSGAFMGEPAYGAPPQDSGADADDADAGHSSPGPVYGAPPAPP